MVRYKVSGFGESVVDTKLGYTSSLVVHLCRLWDSWLNSISISLIF